MSNTSWAWAPVVALVSLSACAAAGSLPPAGPEGCYQIVWNRDMARLDMPWGFELLDAPLPDPPGGRPAFRARTRATADQRTELPFTYWQPLDDGALRIGYPLGGSVAVDVHFEAGTLAGTARSVGDAIEPGQAMGPRASVAFRAVRVVCPVIGGGGS